MKKYKTQGQGRQIMLFLAVIGLLVAGCDNGASETTGPQEGAVQSCALTLDASYIPLEEALPCAYEDGYDGCEFYTNGTHSVYVMHVDNVRVFTNLAQALQGLNVTDEQLAEHNMTRQEFENLTNEMSKIDFGKEIAKGPFFNKTEGRS